MEKIDARTLKPEVQEQLRKQAIQLRQKGHSILQIAAILDVNPRTVYRWCQLHNAGYLCCAPQTGEGTYG